MECVTIPRRQIILAGYLAALAAALIAGADYLLEFNKEVMISSSIIEANWPEMAGWRFPLSLHICAFAIFGYLPGFSILYLILAKTHRLAARLITGLFAFGVVSGSSLIHGVMAINPVIYRFGITQGLSLDLLGELIEQQITSAVFPLFIAHYLLTWIIAPALLFVLVLSGKTLLPRAAALLNPLLFLVFALIFQQIAPIAGAYVTPGSINKAMALLFLFMTHFYRVHMGSQE